MFGSSLSMTIFEARTLARTVLELPMMFHVCPPSMDFSTPMPGCEPC